MFRYHIVSTYHKSQSKSNLDSWETQADRYKIKSSTCDKMKNVHNWENLQNQITVLWLALVLIHICVKYKALKNAGQAKKGKKWLPFLKYASQWPNFWHACTREICARYKTSMIKCVPWRTVTPMTQDDNDDNKRRKTWLHRLFDICAKWTKN